MGGSNDQAAKSANNGGANSSRINYPKQNGNNLKLRDEAGFFVEQILEGNEKNQEKRKSP
jgi:hypothetical protein